MVVMTGSSSVSTSEYLKGKLKKQVSI
jgi:hypothetical protein